MTTDVLSVVAIAVGCLAPEVVAGAPPAPPDFLGHFRESLLAVSRSGLHDRPDLSVDDPCLRGSVSFGKGDGVAKNSTSCSRNGSEQLSCSLSDGHELVILTLQMLGGCKDVPKVPHKCPEDRPLYLAIWVPILAVVVLGILIGLATWTAVKMRKKYQLTGTARETKDQDDCETSGKERVQSTSSACTETTVISETLGPASPIDLSLSSGGKSDSAFSSLKTLGPIREDEDSTADEANDKERDSSSDSSSDSGTPDSCRDLTIIFSGSTTVLPTVLCLDFDGSNVESSTDATLRLKKKQLKIESEGND